METESNKVRSVVNEDRFSSLPDELIHQILSCFDTKFAVQTPILSSRWKHIWKSMPESFEPFSKCVNLMNLILRRVIVHAKVFDIITPRVTKLMLIDCEHSQIANVIAPQLENLTVIDSSINYTKAPLRLSYLCYSGGQHPSQWFKDCFQSLNECISSFPDLISNHPSPFSNLISLTINSNFRDRLDAHKLKMTTVARNFLLENSPSATLIMDLPKQPPTKAMKAKLAREKRAKLVAEIQTRMKKLQTSLDQENIRYIERKQAEEEMKTALEYLMTELKILNDKRTTQSELDKKAQIEEPSRMKVLISAYFREIADMCVQEYDKALSFYTKMTDIRLLVSLRKLTQQMAEMEACYSSQLEETVTLLTRLLLT
nr:hypothetical protein [Tanacetum cinerariifolium]